MGIFNLLVRGSPGGRRAWPGPSKDRHHARQACRLRPGRLEPRRVLDASAAGMLYSGLDGLSDYVEVGSLGDSMPAPPAGIFDISTLKLESIIQLSIVKLLELPIIMPLAEFQLKLQLVTFQLLLL